MRPDRLGEGPRGGGGGGGGGGWAGCSLVDHTIFLMLGLLKLPALRCFWT